MMCMGEVSADIARHEPMVECGSKKRRDSQAHGKVVRIHRLPRNGTPVSLPSLSNAMNHLSAECQCRLISVCAPRGRVSDIHSELLRQPFWSLFHDIKFTPSAATNISIYCLESDVVTPQTFHACENERSDQVQFIALPRGAQGVVFQPSVHPETHKWTIE